MPNGLFRALLGVALLGALGGLRAQTGSLTIGAFEYPPIYQNQADKGLSGEIALAAFKAANVDAVLRFYPVARMIHSVKTGDVPCAIGGAILFENELKARQAVQGEILQYVAQTFFYDTRRFPAGIQFSTLEEIDRTLIVGVLYSSGIMKLLEKIPALNLTHNTSHDGLARQLVARRIDLWAAVDLTGYMHLKTLYPKEAPYFAITRSYHHGDVSLICGTKNNEHAKILSQFAEGLGKIKKNGEYMNIMAKYYGGIDRINRESLPKDLR